MMWATVVNYGVPWRGDLEYTLTFGVLLDNDVPPAGVSPSIPEFIAEHEPVTAAEVAEIFELDDSQAV